MILSNTTYMNMIFSSAVWNHSHLVVPFLWNSLFSTTVGNTSEQNYCFPCSTLIAGYVLYRVKLISSPARSIWFYNAFARNLMRLSSAIAQTTDKARSLFYPEYYKIEHKTHKYILH